MRWAERRRVVGVALVLLATLGPAAAEETPGPAIDVRVVNGALAVDARDAPLAEVLRAIGDRAHVAVTVSGRLDGLVTRSFVSSSVEDAVRQLVRGHSTVWTYAPSRTAPGGQRPTRLVVIATTNASARVSPEERAARLRQVRDLARRRDGASTSELARFSRDADARVRSEALGILSGRGGPEAVAAFETALADQTPSIRMQALRGLQRTQGDAATSSIAGALRNDTDPRVRSTAASLLAAMRPDDARRALEGAVSDADPSVRRAAAAALARRQSLVR
jgi:hypothetical protein